MVKLLQMSETGEGTTPLHVNLEQAKMERGKPTAFGVIVALYNNEQTGERVRMCWIDANKEFPSDEHGIQGGEELFILDGSLQLKSMECYNKWGWLRFPTENSECVNRVDRADLRAGINGAQVYQKTGHLTEQALSMEHIQINGVNGTI